MERILLIVAAPDYQTVHLALQSARSMARHPQCLSWGICLEQAPDAEARQAMAELGSAQYLCPAFDGWQSMTALWRGERYVLMGHPAMCFTKGWDDALLRVLTHVTGGGKGRAVLTGWLPLWEEWIDEVSPVGAAGFDEEGALYFQRGTPLRYAAAPQRNALLHPAFCFATADFFQDMAQMEGPLFLRAYRAQWQPYTLHRPMIRMAWDVPMPPCTLEGAGGGSVRGLRQFEKRWGIWFETRQVSARARQGIDTEDRRFAVHVPFRIRLRECRMALQGRSSRVSPICVTACVALSEPPSLPEEYLGWFANLRELRHLPLLCYADSESMRRVEVMDPKARPYKRRYGLPAALTGGQATQLNLNVFKLGKPFLLHTTREKLLTPSHYVWLDFGYLRYPVYARAWLNWDSLCTDRIVLSAVNGLPDLSMLIVPEKLVIPLCQAVSGICAEVLAGTGSLPEETALWMMLISERPEWFHIYTLPVERALLTLLTQEGVKRMEGAMAHEN